MTGKSTPPRASPLDQVMALRHYLFTDGPLRATTREGYSDIRSSFIEPVIKGENGGLPITLAVIFQSIARRLNFKVDLIGHPGHFLVRFENTFIDVFHGLTYTLGDLVDRLRAQGLPVLPQFVNPGDDFLVLKRVEYETQCQRFGQCQFTCCSFESSQNRRTDVDKSV